jgi:hypothetical protein
MRVVKWVVNILVALMVLMGIVWILQGVNILPGSFMTGDIQWAYRGAAMVVVGALVLAWVNWRRR